MKKKAIVTAIGVVAYLSLLVAICMGTFEPKEQTFDEIVSEQVEKIQEAEQEAESRLENILTAIANREFAEVANTLEYAQESQNGRYVETEDILVEEKDKQSLLHRHALPALERMAEDDAKVIMSEIQVLKKIELMEIDTTLFYTPEYNWKAIYGDSIATVKAATEYENQVEFKGTKASELNEFLADVSNTVVCVMSDVIYMDEVILVPSNVALEGNGASLVALEGASVEENVAYAFLAENVQNSTICDFKLLSGFDYGIYIIESHNMLIWNNEITNALYKALCVMGTNQYVNLVNNSIHDNGNGAIFLNGDISNCIIQGNAVYQNRGTRNLTAGIVFSSMIVEDLYTAYNEFLDEFLYDLTKSPHNNVVKDNLIQGNYSSGYYSDGAYMNYVIDNTIEDNEKEGMCLDYGTFGTYVSGNTIQRNGVRNRQTDEDLEADFVLGIGRMPDGSSKAKLPGISIDNSAYNIVYNNNINGNSGSGVKMVRSGYRNIVLSNLITDNATGLNDFYHGFGVELGYAVTPDEPVKGLDFTPTYENIVARNVISGPHYAGIFLAQESYCNDLIDNVIMECTDFSIENHSNRFNSGVGNNSNVGTLNFEL